MLKGVDVSHWNKVASLKKVNNNDFMIVKLTEGKTYNDKSAEDWIEYAKSCDMLVGVYHYARPEKNGYAVEAAHFVERVKALDLIGEAILALDYEGTALKYGEDWALGFLTTVYEMTGVKPLLYVSSAYTDKFPSVAASDYGLWVADWTGDLKASDYAPWTVVALHQYTNTPIDCDNFHGDADAWAAYAGVKLPAADSADDNDDDSYTIHFCGCELCEAVKAVLKNGG